MKTSRTGFTLIETMVVLMISVLVLALTITTFDHFNLNRLHDYFFWKRFQGEFELCESMSKEYQTTTEITSTPHDKVVFHNSRMKAHVIKMPKNLSTERKDQMSINTDGYISPQTWVWVVNGHKVDQKFQLGWGLYNLEDEK